MTLTTKSYERYQQSLSNTPGPINPNDPLFSIKIDWKGLRSFAQSVNKQVHELSDEEIDPYVVGGISHLKEVRGW